MGALGQVSAPSYFDFSPPRPRQQRETHLVLVGPEHLLGAAPGLALAPQRLL